ncbi:unnamed protein product [Lactuca virosa]|uniref:Uncharacterized protein n=1 Tax=Lactuca virosa TaxID=75947 RepID=A0AAU9PFS8_9ASTR|nr:unnamed protein product [Lactuca virosa]
MSENTSTSALDTSTIPPPLSPPPTLTITPTTIPVVSPTFAGIINEPIASLFSSQSTDQEPLHKKEDEFTKFVELEFNSEEDNVDENAIMHTSSTKSLTLNSTLFFSF